MLTWLFLLILWVIFESTMNDLMLTLLLLTTASFLCAHQTYGYSISNIRRHRFRKIIKPFFRICLFLFCTKVSIWLCSFLGRIQISILGHCFYLIIVQFLSCASSVYLSSRIVWYSISLCLIDIQIKEKNVKSSVCAARVYKLPNSYYRIEP